MVCPNPFCGCTISQFPRWMSSAGWSFGDTEPSPNLHKSSSRLDPSIPVLVAAQVSSPAGRRLNCFAKPELLKETNHVVGGPYSDNPQDDPSRRVVSAGCSQPSTLVVRLHVFILFAAAGSCRKISHEEFTKK